MVVDTIYLAIVDRNVGPEVVQTVNARDLHAFLGVGSKFPDWMRDRIDQCYLVENQDFVRFSVFGSEGRGGNNRIEYYLSLDSAKHFAMLERNDKGKQIRQHFIDVERKARAKSSAPVLPDFSNKILAAQAWIEAQKQLEASEQERLLLTAQVEAQAPAVEFAKAVGSDPTGTSVGDFAKIIGWGPKKLFIWLRENSIFQRSRHEAVPYQTYVDDGFFYIKNVMCPDSVVRRQSFITGSGQRFLYENLGIIPATPKPVLS
jgi:anti-repressor protein